MRAGVYLLTALALCLPGGVGHALPAPIQAISGRSFRLSPSAPVAALFDAHGVLLKPTWRDEYALAYRTLLPAAGAAEASAWVEANTIHVSAAEIARRLAQACGKPEDVAARELLQAREAFQDGSRSEAAPGALELVQALRADGVPIVVMSGSSREVLIAQLKAAGFLRYIPEEMIVGRDDLLEGGGLRPRDAAVVSVSRHFPGHEWIHFNDGFGGMAGVREIQGLNVALPQGHGAEFERNQKTLVEAGGDVVLGDGLASWRRWYGRLAIEARTQEQARARDIPNADGPARELNLVLPAPRPDPLPLHIDVSDDLETLAYSRADDAGVHRGRRSDFAALRLQEISRFASSHLISPLRVIAHTLAAGAREAIGSVWGLQKRYTRYRGVTVSWDSEVDRHVWTTNIDTVFLHQRLEASGLLERIKVRRAAEIGVGGGHGASVWAQRLATLTELSVTDISIYALRAAQRNIRSYLRLGVVLRSFLGKGLGALPAALDLILVNPPYIPAWPGEPGAPNDPYRGTGLIREIVEKAAEKLDPANPEASVVINISSMAEADFQRYLREFDGRWSVEPVGAPLEAPLKIVSISDSWKEWLVQQGGLRRLKSPRPDQEPYWHSLQVYRLKRLSF